MSKSLDDRLGEIEGRLVLATAWPWRDERGWVIAPAVRAAESHTAEGPDGPGSWEFYGGELVCESIERADAHLVANAPSDLAFLIDVVRMLTADRRRLEFLLDERYACSTRDEVDALMKDPTTARALRLADDYEIVDRPAA
ncbi:MAG TPA: hypothetical protein VFN76_09750 [Candidatus Limnocylindria bacterium]|nr:hypothetical protein [Candidatus Limnocylindria bacterium]